MSATFERIRTVAVEHLGFDPEKVTPNAAWIDDLGADCLDCLELTMALEEQFEIEISDDVAETITTVGEAAKAIDRLRGL